MSEEAEDEGLDSSILGGYVGTYLIGNNFVEEKVKEFPHSPQFDAESGIWSRVQLYCGSPISEHLYLFNYWI